MSAKAIGFTALTSAPTYLASYNPSASSAWYTQDAATDSSNNFYVVGYQSNFITKYNSSGVLQWQKTSASVNTFTSVCSDTAGNIYAAGSSATLKGYIAKFNTSGNVTAQTELEISGGPQAQCKSIYVDTSGNVYVTIHAFVNCCTVQYITVKLNSSLTIVWQKVFSTSTSNAAVTADSSGNVYICDSSSGLAIGKFDSSGAALWHYRVGNVNSFPARITLDSAGNPVVCGSFYDGAGYNSFVVKLNAAGTLAWARLLAESTGLYSSNAQGVSCDASDNVYFTGTQSANGFPALLIAKYNSSGTLQWQRSMTNSTWDGSGYGVVSPGTGNVYVAGWRRYTSGAGVMLGSLPSDGSKTGSYTVGSETFTYAVASNTASTPSVTLANAGTTTSNGSLIQATPAYTFTNLTNLAYVTVI
jgi:hypothetical protein